MGRVEHRRNRVATLAFTALLIALPTTALSANSDLFPCVEGQHILPDALDIRDNEHALAVMRRHPELKKLPGYLDESIEGDYIEKTTTPGGRQGRSSSLWSSIAAIRKRAGLLYRRRKPRRRTRWRT